MKIEFERAMLEDAEAINEVQNLSFYSDYVKYGACPGYNHTKESMERIIETAYDYKILCNGKIVGNIIVRPKENGEYYLGGLCVIPQYENLGIGQQSLTFLECEFPNAKLWSLVTPAGSEKNHYFYEKAGFIKTGESVDCSVPLFHYTKIISMS
ncbi:MAG TPA: GNAT family N-acetyltransferase [Oscillospiraceae bacterium]|nr:GNAT family N-acetyltransferase [Oscillospiraceae bacterium]